MTRRRSSSPPRAGPVCSLGHGLEELALLHPERHAGHPRAPRHDSGHRPEHDAKLQRLYRTIRDKQEHPINEGNRKILVFTAFADTADYLYEHVSEYAKTLGLETAEVTGSRPGRCTVRKVGGDMGDILACFSPESKERNVTDPRLKDCDIDILIATDCISEGQNLQDCDMMVNYDIHWNPVRIVQRFGAWTASDPRTSASNWSTTGPTWTSTNTFDSRTEWKHVCA